MTKFDKFMDSVRLMARLAPLPNGPIPNGNSIPGDMGTRILVLIDGAGRVFQIEGAEIKGGGFYQITNGRSALLKLMDEVDVQDFPAVTGL